MMILADDMPIYEGYLALAYCILTGAEVKSGLAKFGLIKPTQGNRYDKAYKNGVAKRAINLMAAGFSLSKASTYVGHGHNCVKAWIQDYEKELN